MTDLELYGPAAAAAAAAAGALPYEAMAAIAARAHLEVRGPAPKPCASDSTPLPIKSSFRVICNFYFCAPVPWLSWCASLAFRLFSFRYVLF